MGMRRPSRKVGIFSMSALDLSASGLVGVLSKLATSLGVGGVA